MTFILSLDQLIYQGRLVIRLTDQSCDNKRRNRNDVYILKCVPDFNLYILSAIK